jgi:hypothetical protein
MAEKSKCQNFSIMFGFFFTIIFIYNSWKFKMAPKFKMEVKILSKQIFSICKKCSGPVRFSMESPIFKHVTKSWFEHLKPKILTKLQTQRQIGRHKASSSYFHIHWNLYYDVNYKYKKKRKKETANLTPKCNIMLSYIVWKRKLEAVFEWSK